jgi:hypothetical protein
MEYIIIDIKCWSCDETFKTQNEMSTHHLDHHFRPLPIDWYTPWEMHPATTPRFVPPNWKAQAAREFTVNGETPWPAKSR